MHYLLDVNELTIIQEISDITDTDYEVDGRVVPANNLVVALENLLDEYHKKEKELEDLKNDIENNYEIKNINSYEEYGVSEKDFI